MPVTRSVPFLALRARHPLGARAARSAGVSDACLSDYWVYCWMDVFTQFDTGTCEHKLAVVVTKREKWSFLGTTSAAAPTGLAACSRMDSEAHTRDARRTRGHHVRRMLCRYAHQLSALDCKAAFVPPGSLPGRSEIYREHQPAVAFGPMVLLQDGSTGELLRHFEEIQSQTVAHATAACIRGIGASLSARRLRHDNPRSCHEADRGPGSGQHVPHWWSVGDCLPWGSGHGGA